MTGSSSTTTPCSLTSACKLMRLHLVRWVRVYLLGANRILCVLAYFKHCLYAILRLAQFLAAVPLYVSKLILSAKPSSNSSMSSWFKALSSSTL